MEQAAKDRQLAMGQVLWPALRVGTLSGISGLVFGGVAGLFRSSSPTLFALLAGAQWFGLGSTFWGLRGLMFQYRGISDPPIRDKVLVSSVAGGCTGGGLGFLTRGRANIIPGAIMFSIFGAGTQGILSMLTGELSQDSRSDPRKPPVLQRIVQSKWMPMKILSDEEYLAMLENRLLKVDAEVAVIDQEMQSLRPVPKASANQSIKEIKEAQESKYR